ncbi:hypothetical protein N8I77_005852 [Diaporthe amygdali]|uniref:Diterpenoid pyrone biosynthesis cluster protein C n=1 Tax=Phomopsis amygdali TaxID=1214568 RepID=A0AAD9W5Z7_PHOAM|nr:hypothetical protein N8I77_005852 [Diaporthe amygdali]
MEKKELFPGLPPYKDPTRGLLSKLPPPWIPYGQLMRLDRPGGFYAYYFPYLIGFTYASCIAPTPLEPKFLLRWALVLLPFSLLLRGVACTWNDTVDQKFDRCVRRTCHRPVARGAVTTTQGHLFTLIQAILLYIVVINLGVSSTCILHTTVTVVLFCVYALMKRITYYPEVVLGVPFAWAIFFSVAALGMEPLDAHIVWSTVSMFGSNALWTVTYSVIYSHQDIADDEAAGVKNMAVRFKNGTKPLVGLLTFAQVALLAVCGLWAGFGPLYYIGSVGGVAAAMAYYIYDVDLGKPESCFAWFGYQFWTVGGAYMLGLAGELLRRM